MNSEGWGGLRTGSAQPCRKPLFYPMPRRCRRAARAGDAYLLLPDAPDDGWLAPPDVEPLLSPEPLVLLPLLPPPDDSLPEPLLPSAVDFRLRVVSFAIC